MELLTKEQHEKHLEFFEDLIHAEIIKSRFYLEKKLTEKSLGKIILQQDIDSATKHHESLLDKLRYITYLQMNLDSVIMLASEE